MPAYATMRVRAGTYRLTPPVRRLLGRLGRIYVHVHMFRAALQQKNERSEKEGSFEKKFLFLNEGKLARIAGATDSCDN